MSSDGRRRLHLLCRNEVAVQVERAIGAALGDRLPIRAADEGEWTHRYPLARPLTEEEVGFLELLGHVLTLRIGPPVVVAIALDWYKDPQSHEDPDLWADTHVGELIHEAKYAGSAPHAKKLVAELAQVMAQHPDLSQAEVVVSVPSHSPGHFSERLAKAVANVRKLPLAELTDNAAAPVKDTPADERPAREFAIEAATIKRRSVILIDDVCRSGESLRTAAAFLDSVGASSVSALVAVRTMRN
ncbi:MAG: phosphoribosyltransferase family protein [Chloroflexota bacterium]